MSDLCGVVDANLNITRFYVAPDFGVQGANIKLISGTAETPISKDAASQYEVLKLVSGGWGYKYKWVDPTITAKTDDEVKAALEWMEQKRDQLDQKTTTDISDLGENKLHALCVKDAMNRLNSGPALSSGEITDMQGFDDDRDSLRNQFHNDAKDAGFSRLKSASTDSDSTTVDLKRSSAFEVDDLITIVDYGDGKRETGKITDITSATITFEFALTNTTKYKKKSSWVFKTG